MHQNQPGSSVPEERFAIQPFYYDLPPSIYRWYQWRGVNKWDAFQRWLYSCFCGRTQDSIWESECAPQDEGAIKNQGDYSDPLNWNIPQFVHPAAGAEYLGQPNAYSNYFHLDENVRAANPKTGLAAQTDADDFYLATRHSFPRVGYRIAMKLPTANELTAMHTAHPADHDTYMGLGFEVNSQGEHQIAVFDLLDSGAGHAYTLRHWQSGQHMQTARTHWSAFQRPQAAVTINNPGTWCWYYMEYDPPVLRFVQPIAGQTNYWGDSTQGYADLTEISVPNVPSYAYMQPMIFNESNAYTGDHLTWEVGQWAITPLHNTGSRYQVNQRSNPNATCPAFSAIWDSGAAEHIHINVTTLGCGCAYTIEWSDEGEDNPAAMPEVRTWRRIDDADYTGVTGTPSGEAGIGLFNAARFIRVTLAGCNACGNEYIVYTGNKSGRG